MPENALKCPQCGGPLTPGKFARIAKCPHCGSTVTLDEQTVSAARFREAYREWNSPANNGFSEWLTINGSHWAVGEKVAQGEISDVYLAQRARRPTEFVIIKILRNTSDVSRFENEWQVLDKLHHSEARGASTFSKLLPQPVTTGEVSAGIHKGSRAMVFRRAEGFSHSLEEVRRRNQSGIDPRSSIWLWRRILEVLSFIHASGVVHGAVLPPHVIVEAGEHGARLIGYGSAGDRGSRLQFVANQYKSYYPEGFLDSMELAPRVDIVMSARTIAVLLGGDAATCLVPDAVPRSLAELIVESGCWSVEPKCPDAWALHERLGTLAQQVYGAPKFCPIIMAKEEE